MNQRNTDVVKGDVKHISSIKTEKAGKSQLQLHFKCFLGFLSFYFLKQCVGEEHSSVHQSSSSCTLSTQQSLHYFTAASRESILSLFLCCLSYSSASHVGQETMMVLVSLCHHQKCISVSLVGLAFWFFICIIWVQRQ